MFHRLRKILITGFFGVLACLGVNLYLTRDIFYPAVDFVEAYRSSRDSEARSTESLSGQIVKVEPACTVQLKATDGKLYRIGATGLDIPPTGKDASEIDKKMARALRSRLNHLVLSNQVQVQITFMGEKRSGLGILYLGETNVNATIIGDGVVKLKRDYLKGLDLKSRYALIRAEKEARRHYLGIWSRDIPPESTFNDFLTRVTPW